MGITIYFPVEDRVIVEIIKPSDTTPMGLVKLEDTTKAQKGKVLAVGPGRPSLDGSQRIRPTVRMGDIILFPRHTGFEIEGAIVLRESDVLSVVTESE